MDGDTAVAIRQRRVEVGEPRMNILLVDDNTDTLASMAAVLEVLGQEVLTAASPEAALAVLLKHDVAVIVLDVMMPGMDGFELAAIIRQRERLSNVPIIFLTGLGSENGEMLRGYRSGAVDYLLKPCDPEVLRSKVKVFVDLARTSELLRRYAQLAEQKNLDLEKNSRKLQDALATTLDAYGELEREVAERKRAEASRDRLAGQLSATPDFVEAMAEGAVTLALDDTILYCNSKFGAMVGRSSAELTGLPVTSLIARADAGAFLGLLGDARQGTVKAELDLLASNGESIPVQVALSAFRGSDLEAFAMVVTDLRHHKRNEALLAEGRLARQILQSAFSGIAVCDAAGRVVLASSVLSEICACNPLFKSLDDVLRLEVPGQGMLSVLDVVKGEVHRSTEAVFRRSDGHVFTLVLSAGPVTSGSAGETGTFGCVVSVMDITEQKHVNEALRRSEKLAAAGRIAGALAHEVNNPLTAITNLLFLLQQSSTLDEIGRHYLDQACEETERVSHIVRKTLAFYRDSTSPVGVDLAAVVDNVLEVFSTTIHDKNLLVSKRCSWDGRILGYPGEIRQVVTNLLANAIDALGEGGQMHVHVHGSREWSNGGRPGVRIVVADTGAGIPREHLAKLFEPFFTTKGEKGTGLGLWVTEGIVQKHGGSIRVRSSTRPGRSGTVFSVFIPVFAEAGRELEARSAAAAENPQAA